MLYLIGEYNWNVKLINVWFIWLVTVNKLKQWHWIIVIGVNKMIKDGYYLDAFPLHEVCEYQYQTLVSSV